MGLPAGRDVAVITPWYPNRKAPLAGAFVQSMVEATQQACSRVTVYHVDGWGIRVPVAHDEAIQQVLPQLLTRAVGVGTTIGGAELRYLPVPARVGISFAELAQLHSDALRTALGGAKIDADVVHGHVGLRGGWTALENARPGARVFVTEHSSFLPTVLAQPDSRAMYDEVLSRVDGFFVVGEWLRATLAAEFPQHADRISLMANPVSFEEPRKQPVTELLRWLYVGSLREAKGVTLLLEAFARCRAEEPSLSLTFVGDGAMRAPLVKRAAELGVTEAVTFTGTVTPDQALQMMREHDVLVHPSRLETFGMVVVEASAAGLPVLVTRCGGPETTLAGIEDDAGGLMDVTDDPDTIVDAFHRLRDRFPGQVDLGRARSVLHERYGFEAVGQAHVQAWWGAAQAISVPAASSPLE